MYCGNLPCGARSHDGPRRLYYICPNPDCQAEWTAKAYAELGGVFLEDDSDGYCPECQTEGELE